MRPVAAIALLTGLAMALPAAGTVIDPNWSESVFSVNRDTPGDTSGKLHTGLAWAPDGSDRLFVLEKNGRVRVLSGSLTTNNPAWSTFATMSPIYTGSECGLIGMAFDPDFANNRYVYFFVTASSSEQQILRYDASGSVGTGRTVIRSGLPTTGNNHDGGGIGFAADGKLYWSIGDLGNGTGVNSDLSSLAAKVGRANRDGTLPTDNPFDDGAGPNNDFIYARGFRNPFTMQIQPATGLIWLNVVGTNYEQVFVVGRGDHGGYNTYENNQPAGFITPRIVYRTNGSDSRTLVSASRVGNVASFTTTGAHGFRVGGNLTISGTSDASFNLSNQYVASVPTTTTFTVAQVGANATATGGLAVTLNQGGCLTGGAFYDATLATPAYRGNFYYGDCNSGQIMRARIDTTSNQVQGVDIWASGIAGQVDVASGPDGALYYTGTSTNNILRATVNTASQGLVVANQNLRIDEGGAVVTTVRLATAPAADLSVGISRTAGDNDVGVAAGAALTFTPADWMRPQPVRLAATLDPDTTDDLATVTVTASGLTSVPIRVTVLDAMAPVDGIFGNGFE